MFQAIVLMLLCDVHFTNKISWPNSVLTSGRVYGYERCRRAELRVILRGWGFFNLRPNLDIRRPRLWRKMAHDSNVYLLTVVGVLGRGLNPQP